MNSSPMHGRDMKTFFNIGQVQQHLILPGIFALRYCIGKEDNIMPKIQLYVPKAAWANALVLLLWVLMWVRDISFLCSLCSAQKVSCVRRGLKAKDQRESSHVSSKNFVANFLSSLFHLYLLCQSEFPALMKEKKNKPQSLQVRGSLSISFALPSLYGFAAVSVVWRVWFELYKLMPLLHKQISQKYHMIIIINK